MSVQIVTTKTVLNTAQRSVYYVRCCGHAKVKQSHYRPGVAQKIPGNSGSQIS